ncbi:TetR/AcrR family transcriptional regulator [Streptomyces sp. NPDC005840]|uniref:TetR/AcrR family transcriptional regulator n=1 Tax=Streptomyces doudnae TaxID=3075536 RepID=A0ABD5EQR1_9ACTN|nr:MULTISPECIES: TetR/AcrR family transcriptional regulator [unclassified Streptomyces]MDT0436379.1 TetR/AcrR family transcriptional regulator [Streptomyces sp. DSM 41981]MYQ62221.1 TetR family transcriptional regulator [Streptomyces sp. SID4950]SCD33033.1 transcriptional regulator, TetR family [Streptomyces sp. SolWspMP-5a-2]
MTQTGEAENTPQTGVERQQRRKPGLERLLATADELLYAEGIQQTGVQRILEQSNVARGTLYGNFGGKDDLIAAYLQRRHTHTLAAVTTAIEHAHSDDPADVFDALLDVGESRSQQGSFRGCAFALAVAEMPAADGPAAHWARTHKTAIKALLKQALTGRVAVPERTAESLMVLYDGALLSAALRPGEDSFEAARAAGRLLITTALLPPDPAPGS